MNWGRPLRNSAADWARLPSNWIVFNARIPSAVTTPTGASSMGKDTTRPGIPTTPSGNGETDTSNSYITPPSHWVNKPGQGA